jgi:D-serine deaminase-like pyridoxal phosphate-dependent protein
MLANAASRSVTLRPHCKTHKTVEGALLQTGGRRGTITVSTLAEVEFYVANGFDDVLYAVPITPHKVPAIGALLAQGANIHICVDHPEQLSAVVERAAARSGAEQWSVVIMVDSGMHRDGVSADADEPLCEELAAAVAAAEHCTLFGCYTHGGHSYTTDGLDAVHAVGEAERDAVVEVARRVKAATGVALPSIGVGSTPTGSNPPEHLDGVTELHPGNFIFYDVQQASYGSCTEADIGIYTLTRVVGHYPRSNTLLIDLGWTGCSKQGPGEA